MILAALLAYRVEAGLQLVGRPERARRGRLDQGVPIEVERTRNMASVEIGARGCTRISLNRAHVEDLYLRDTNPIEHMSPGGEQLRMGRACIVRSRPGTRLHAYGLAQLPPGGQATVQYGCSLVAENTQYPPEASSKQVAAIVLADDHVLGSNADAAELLDHALLSRTDLRIVSARLR
jgi:hypothetical protein